MKSSSRPSLNQVSCPGCGKSVHDQAVGCPSCGASINVEHPGDITPTKHPPLNHSEGSGTPQKPSRTAKSHGGAAITNNRSVEGQCLVAQYAQKDHFDMAVAILEKAGFLPSEVSFIQHESAISGTRLENAIGKDTSTPPTGNTLAATSTIGGVFGGAVGAVSAVGPLLIAGPLVGLLAGAVGGSILSAVDGWGVEHKVASHYENEARNGKRLIVVASDDTIRLDNAERVLKTSDHDSIRRFRNAAG